MGQRVVCKNIVGQRGMAVVQRVLGSPCHVSTGTGQHIQVMGHQGNMSTCQHVNRSTGQQVMGQQIMRHGYMLWVRACVCVCVCVLFNMLRWQILKKGF